MVFVDALVQATESLVICTFAITEHTACLRDGRLPGLYVIEAMAQAAAAHVGAVALWLGEPRGGGYLVGLRHVILGCAAFAPGEQLEIEAHNTFRSDQFASYACQVRCAGTDVASATLNVLRKPA